MNMRLVLLSILTLLSVSWCGCLHAASELPIAARQTNSTPPLVAKKPSPGPFRGKVVAVDVKGRTIQISKRTFLVASDARITRNGAPARLEDAKLGEEAGGYVKPDDKGRLIATSLRLGPKPEASTKAKRD
jgi:hypothetical protein